MTYYSVLRLVRPAGFLGKPLALLAISILHLTCALQPVPTGTEIDRWQGVPVFYNGFGNNVHGRNRSADGYNLGLKWQCVEFVKRFYYEHYAHRMPNSWGHAKDFFLPSVPDSTLNPARGLLQWANGAQQAPQAGDILVLDGTALNPYGHVAIVVWVESNRLEVVQQNVGMDSRDQFALEATQGGFRVADERVLGWLRLPTGR